MVASVVVFRVGGRLYALPISCVIETMRALPLDRIVGPTEAVLGMSIIRGVPTPVVDAGLLLGDQPSSSGRFITLRVGARSVGLAVDEVIGVRTMNEATMLELPPLLAGASSGAAEQLGTLDGELFVVLDSARLVPDGMLDVLVHTDE